MDNNLSQSIQNVAEQSPISFSDGPSQVGKKDRKPLITGVICGLVGLALGGAGIFGLIKLTEKPNICPECNCLEQNSPISSSSLDLGFLKLENNNENIIYSPLSIRYGLSLLSAGADGKTATEINDVLGDADLPTYQNEANTLSLANAVFIKNEFKDSVSPEYVGKVENEYSSEIIYDDFADTTIMDNWVSQKTFGLINNMGLPLTPDTEMVLSNALATQMSWQDSFNTRDTYGKPFYYDSGEEITATTMQKETTCNNINYYVGNDITILSIPLAETSGNVQLEFSAIMPTSNLGEYIENLTIENLTATLENTVPANTTEAGININIPKFKFDYKLNFKEDLGSLGITTAFNRDNADFSKMAAEPLYVSDAIHKANIDFSEDGIKAAAVTAFSMDNATSAVTEPTVPIDVIINRPFLFVIRDKSNGIIWFAGAMYEPNLWENDVSSYR